MALKRKEEPGIPVDLTNLEKKLDILINSAASTSKDFEQVLAYLDSMKQRMDSLEKEAQKVMSFYASLKKQEQEIFWNYLKGEK